MSQAVDKWNAHFEAMPLAKRFNEICREAPRIKIVKAFKSAHNKFEFRIEKDTITAQTWGLAVDVYLKNYDRVAKELMGAAPRGDLERKLQEFLDSGTMEWEDEQISDH